MRVRARVRERERDNHTQSIIYPTPLQRVFILLDWLPNQGLRTQSAKLFAHCWVGVKKDGFMAFPRPLLRNETQTASSRIWTRIYSISYDDNNTLSAPLIYHIYVCVCMYVRVKNTCVCICVCICMCEKHICVHVCVCVKNTYVCMRM